MGLFIEHANYSHRRKYRRLANHYHRRKYRRLANHYHRRKYRRFATTGGDTGGSTTTEDDTGGSTITEDDTGGSDTIAAETPTDGAKLLLTVEPTAISEDAGATEVVVTATLDGLDGQVFDDDVVVLLTFDEDINGDGAVNGDDKAARTR